MQDRYVGDIGDYGKYGLLRAVSASGLSLGVNWYKVVLDRSSHQDDGKYTNYLLAPQLYRAYDPSLFDSLYQIICIEHDRRIERIKSADLFSARFFSDALDADRWKWHCKALRQTEGTDVIFLDPDNGLETRNMNRSGSATGKHAKWSEVKDYYARGQNVILYQHRPQMTTKVRCIESVMEFQREYLQADYVMLLEFPKYTNRFYFMFLHAKHKPTFQLICASMASKRNKNAFCREIVLV